MFKTMNTTPKMIGRVLLSSLGSISLRSVGGRRNWPLGQKIVFANHASNMDTLLIMAALDDASNLTPLAARDYWTATPMRRFALKLIGAALVDRVPVPGADPLKEAKAVLEEGGSLLMFPEGGRRNGEPFKRGLHTLAQSFPDVPLVPVHIDGSDLALPKGGRLPRMSCANIRVREPMFLREGETCQAFLARARETLFGRDFDDGE